MAVIQITGRPKLTLQMGGRPVQGLLDTEADVTDFQERLARDMAYQKNSSVWSRGGMSQRIKVFTL